MNLYSRSDVTAAARTAIDNNLTTRLGSPQALFALALKVRQATIQEGLSAKLMAEVRTAIAAAIAADPAAMREAVTHFTTLVEAGPIAPETVTQLLAASKVFATAPRRLEAESEQLLAAACRRTDHPGYTGTGFVACLKTKDSGVRSNTPVIADGLYSVRLRYANAMDTTQTMTLTSGPQSIQLQFPTLANWDTWSDHQVSINLSQATPLTIAFGPTDNGDLKFGLHHPRSRSRRRSTLRVTMMTNYLRGDRGEPGLEVYQDLPEQT